MKKQIAVTGDHNVQEQGGDTNNRNQRAEVINNYYTIHRPDDEAQPRNRRERRLLAHFRALNEECKAALEVTAAVLAKKFK